VVLFRAPAGIVALVDRCPHRGVQLSLGKVKDGCLECPFHGWRFGAEGKCQFVPLNPDARRELLSARALPCRERGGLVWIACGDVATGEPHVPEALERKGARVSFHVEEWRCHWTRAMENMLDSPHLPYVHRATIGRAMAARMRPESRMDQTLIETEVGFELSFRLDDEPSNGKLLWLRPNGMQLHILDGEPGARFLRIHVWCVPTKADHTRMLLATTQDFGLLNPLLGLGDFYNRKILREDRAVVESSSPSRVPLSSADGVEQSVATDKPTLYFRKWYREVMAATSGEEQQR
jgi:phenylpropionate dioxygenase-like ring-hydroxylating dioxygenase large terminal subunit